MSIWKPRWLVAYRNGTVMANKEQKTAAVHVLPNSGDFAERTRLRSVIAAQKWDIAGLTEQRDTLLQKLADGEKAVAALEARIALQRAEQERARKAAAALREEAQRGRQGLLLGAAVLDLLPPIVEGAPDPALEARLLLALGLIDAEFYQRQCPRSLTPEELARHYLASGEAAGLSPHPLFDPGFYRTQLAPDQALPTSLLCHYLLQGWRNGFAPHPLFDGEYYAQRYNVEGINPLLHFLRIGAPARLAPHPLFNPDHYAAGIPELRERDSLALIVHFLAEGARAGRSPSPFFDMAFYLRRNPALAETGINPLLHYIFVGEAEGRMPNIGFDPAYYRAQLGTPAERAGSAIAHFIKTGCARGLLPSPLFDPAFYVRANPDVAMNDKNPLEHYLEFGGAEGRGFHPLIDLAPLRAAAATAGKAGENALRLLVEDRQFWSIPTTPLFAPAYYLGRYKEVAEAACGPLEHFLRWGAQAGHDPHPLFMTTFYATQVDWRRRSPDPLSDYLRFGAAEGWAPHPLFHGKSYIEFYDDLSRDRPNPLLHYLEHGGRGTERRKPHLLFDPEFFLSQITDPPDVPHLQHFLTMPLDQLADPHPLFDCQYYLAQRPELVAAGVNPLLHYMLSPAGQGANPHPLFDEAFYLAQRPELANQDTPLLVHYLTAGYKEYLSPHPCFDSKYIAERSPDMIKEGRIPLLDYLIHGAFREYDPVPWFDSVSYHILHQGADPGAENPLVDFIWRHPDFRPPAPPRLPTSGEKPLSAKGRATFRAEELRAAVAAKGANGKGADGKNAPARATVADVLPAGAMARFIASHDFYCEGAMPAGRKAPRGVALYAIHADAGRLTASHRATIAALREGGNAIVLINSTLAEGRAFLAAARPLADLIVLRANGGRDFASWMATVGMLYGQIAGAEHWVFVNDSLLGPVGDCAPLWRGFRASGAEVWALTESFEQDFHLQSSFFILRRAAFQSAAFLRYLTGYGFPEERIEIVRQGEIGFSAAMKNSPLKIGVMVPYPKLAAAWLAEAPARQRWLDALAEGDAPGAAAMIPALARPAFVRFAEDWLRRIEDAARRGEVRNPQHHFWDTLIGRFAYPFVKRDLLTVNPIFVPTVPRLFEVVGAPFHPVLSASLEPLVGPAPAGGSVLRFSRETLGALKREPEKAPVRRRERVHA